MASPSLLRDIHEVSVLNLLRRDGVSSRAGLAKALGLTRSTLSNLVHDLLEAGYVVESGKPAGATGAGRPGIGLELRPEGAYFLGADVGEEVLRVLLLDLGAGVVEEHSAVFSADEEPADVLERLLAMIDGVRTARGLHDGRLKGIGVTVPGTCVDGRIVLSPALGWADVEVKHRFAAATGLPILVENAANAAALAEVYFDVEDEAPNLVYLLLREGVGAGIVIGGEIYRGAFGAAGEVGNVRLAPDGPVDTKGNVGTLEAFCGLRTLLHDYVAHGGKVATLAALIDGLALGEEAAEAAVSAWGGWLAQGLLTILNVLNPRRIVLGGPLTALVAHVRERVVARIRDEHLPGSRSIDISTSTLGADTSALGGAILVYHAMFSLPELE